MTLTGNCSRRASACSTTGRRKAARRSTPTGAGSTSRSRWTSTTARSAARCSYQQVFDAGGTQCGGGTDPRIGGANGDELPRHDGRRAIGASEQLIGASGVLVAPGIKSQYMDEIIAGFEYEVIDDLKIGVVVPEPPHRPRDRGRVDRRREHVHHREPGRVVGRARSRSSRTRIDRDRRPGDEGRGCRTQLALFQGIRIFDKPRRDYNALQFTVTRRFSKKLYVQGSYTYSRTHGNYPGLFSYDNGQVDPNISSQYDLIELLAQPRSARCRRIARTTSSSTATTRSTSRRPAS